MHYTIRSSSAVVGFWLGTIVIAVVTIVPITTSNWRLLLFAAPVGVLVIWMLWLTLYLPALYYDNDRVIIVNMGRIYLLPWSKVESIDQRLSLIFTLQDGSRITAMGTPYPRRGNLMPTRTTASPSSRNYDGDISILDGFRAGAVEHGEPISRKWDAPALWIGAVIVLLVVLASVVDRI